jgi:hypothetical protein
VPESATAFEPVAARPATDPVAARQARLADAVVRIRRRQGFDVERALHWAGSILLPTGLVIIILGWYGAAHTSYNFEQLPYLISGGILGAAVSVVGGFLYFGYWIARVVEENRRERTDVVELLSRLDNRMAIMEAWAAGSLPGPAGNGAAPPELVATPTGTLVHRRDCSLVAGKRGLREVDPSEPGLKPCKVCQPFSDRAAAPAGRG